MADRAPDRPPDGEGGRGFPFHFHLTVEPSPSGQPRVGLLPFMNGGRGQGGDDRAPSPDSPGAPFSGGFGGSTATDQSRFFPLPFGNGMSELRFASVSSSRPSYVNAAGSRDAAPEANAPVEEGESSQRTSSTTEPASERDATGEGTTESREDEGSGSGRRGWPHGPHIFHAHSHHGRLFESFFPNNGQRTDTGPRMVFAYYVVESDGQSQRKATQQAVDNLKSVRIEDLPEGERTCTVCYEPFTPPREPPASAAASDADPEDAPGHILAESAPSEPANDASAAEPAASDESGTATEEDDDHSPVALPCGHIFGKSCLKQWLQSAASCPLCRETVESEAVHSNRFEWRSDIGAGLNDISNHFEVVAQILQPPGTHHWIQVNRNQSRSMLEILAMSRRHWSRRAAQANSETPESAPNDGAPQGPQREGATPDATEAPSAEGPAQASPSLNEAGDAGEEDVRAVRRLRQALGLPRARDVPTGLADESRRPSLDLSMLADAADAQARERAGTGAEARDGADLAQAAPAAAAAAASAPPQLDSPIVVPPLAEAVPHSAPGTPLVPAARLETDIPTAEEGGTPADSAAESVPESPQLPSRTASPAPSDPSALSSRRTRADSSARAPKRPRRT